MICFFRIGAILRIAHGGLSAFLFLAQTGQPTRQRHQNEKSNNGNRNNHDEHFRIIEALATDDQCGRNIALGSAQCQHTLGAKPWTAEKPADADANQQKEDAC